MKKIMFNDRFGLTEAVLSGRKTMTRRIVTEAILRMARMESNILNKELVDCIKDHTPLCFYDTVAIAQSYHALNKSGFLAPEWLEHTCESSAGYENKMFVNSELMPHHIRITGIRVERLQDISEEDAMREGVFKYDKPPLHHERDMYAPWPPHLKPYKWIGNNLVYRCNARYAFAHLIDKISGNGTWESNPWVFVYEFELID